jgi:hypothetical protein
MFDGDFSRLDSVLDKELHDIPVLGYLATGLFPVCFQSHCTHVVLVQY